MSTSHGLECPRGKKSRPARKTNKTATRQHRRILEAAKENFGFEVLRPGQEEQANLSRKKLVNSIDRLEDVGALDVLPTGEVQLAEEAEIAVAARAAAEEQERRRQIRKRRLDQMREYAHTSSCLREHLLRYFGDAFTGPCKNCDNCEAAAPEIWVDPRIGTRREAA